MPMTHEQSRSFGKPDPGPDPDWREVARIAGEIMSGGKYDLHEALDLAREIVAAAKVRNA